MTSSCCRHLYSVFCSLSSVIIQTSPEITGQIEVKFHVENPWDRGMKVARGVQVT